MKLIFLAFSLLLSGCSTLYIMGPQAIVENPETKGEGGFQESFLKTEANQVFTLTDSASSRPLAINNPPRLENQGALIGGANFLAQPKLTLGFAIDPIAFINGTISIRGLIKYQLIGDHYLAKDLSSHLLSVYAHPISSTLSIGGDQEYMFGPGGYSWSAKSELIGGNIGTTYGYRVSDKCLFYVGAAHMQYHVSGSIHQSASDDGVYPEASGSFPRTHGRSSTVSTGLSYGSLNQLSVAVSYSENKWGSLDDHSWFVNVGINSLSEGRTAILQPKNR